MESSCDANGICLCKENFEGDQCKDCKLGFFQHPNCLGKAQKMYLCWFLLKKASHKYHVHISECKCSEDGAVDSSCDDAGMCTCKSQISGDKCDKCLPGHFNYPTCQSKYLINLEIFKTIINFLNRM